ncbi:protein FAR1-RELATED SEQUENCE 5-like [Rhizophagus irregularis DAOM 181602=DAOM 197198]|nr:protein FAR1-RELATED SEQUENCE 5-like [Rhizophagus irregularis DAOM 181602=DAOM 197198]
MFSQLKKSTGVQPLIIITDSDPAVDAAIHLRKLINEDYENFLTAFYSCRNSIAEEVFQIKFDYLIRDYPSAKPYLEFLYRTKTYWAHCFTKFKFTGGMIASSRVESVNACLKRLFTIPMFHYLINVLINFLTPTILKVHHDEMRQSLYYTRTPDI